LAYGGLMNKYSQESLLRLLEKGGEQFGKSKIMPAFSLNNQLNKMDLMDILEYLDSKSVSIKEHFPQAAEYTIKDYFISGSGLQRVESNIGDSFGQKKVKVTLATVFKGSGKVKKPRLVPQDNQELDKLNKQMKIGYVVYYHDMKVKGKSFPVELAINFMGKILRLELPDQQGLKMSRNIKRFKGYGNRNVRNVFKWRKRRDKRMQSLARSVYIAWLLGQEAIFLFEKEEKDRTWADEDF